MKPNYKIRRSNMKLLEKIQEKKKPKISLKQIFYKYKKNGCNCKCNKN